MGGSQGANIFDKDLRNIIVNISKTNSLKVIQQTKEDFLSLKILFKKISLKMKFLILIKIYFK